MAALVEGLALVALCGGVASTSGGLILGMLGALRPGPFLIAIPVATYSLVVVWRADGDSSNESRLVFGRSVGALGALAAGVGVAVVLSIGAQTRPLADGYEAAAVLVAETASRTGSLENGLGFVVDGAVDVVAPGLRDDGRRWTVDGPRGGAALLTAARWAGPAGGPVLWALLAGLLIVLMYLLAAERLHPATAFLMAAGLGLNPLLWFGTHGMSAAVPAAVLAVGGTWLLILAASEGRVVQGAIAGFTLGSTAMVMPEGWFLPVAAAVFLLAEESGSGRDSLVLKRRSRRFGLAVLGGSLVALSVAAMDAVVSYGLGSVASRVAPAAVGVVVAGGVMRRWGTAGSRPRPARVREGALAVAVVLAAGAAFRLLRDPAGVQAVQDVANRLAAGVGVDMLETSAARHLVFGWLRQHVGLITLLVGSAGLVAMGLVGLRTRDPWLRIPMVMMLVAGGAVMVAPIAVPVQPDGIGVLLPVVLPGLLIGAGFLIDRWWRSSTAGAVGALLTVVALFAFPAWRVQQIGQLFPQDGARAGVESMCAALPADAAVLVIDGNEGEAIGTQVAASVRSFCAVPAAHAGPDLDPADLEAFRLLAGDAGRSLYLVATEPFPLGEGGPVVAKTGELTFTRWVRTVTSYPESTELVVWPIGISVAQ